MSAVMAAGGTSSLAVLASPPQPSRTPRPRRDSGPQGAWRAALPRELRPRRRPALRIAVSAGDLRRPRQGPSDLAAKRGRRAALRGLAGMVIASTASNVVAKALVRRPRPAVEVSPARRPGRTPVTTSFPSGHTAAAAAFATGVGLEMPALAAPVGVLAAVGIARVVNGVHYPSDVIGGWAVGVGVAMLTPRWWPLRRPEPAAAAGPGHEAAAERDL